MGKARQNGLVQEFECPNCEYKWEESLSSRGIVKTTDLRSISRGSMKFRTKIYLTDPYARDKLLWLDFGEANVLTCHSRISPKSWEIQSYLDHGATDSEEDSAFALNLPLMALETEMVMGHNVFLNAVIDPRFPESFRVPRPGYNPLLHPDTVICQSEACLKHAYGAHPIVPDGFYKPPHDRELFDMVKCLPVEIVLISNGVGK